MFGIKIPEQDRENYVKFAVSRMPVYKVHLHLKGWIWPQQSRDQYHIRGGSFSTDQERN